MPKCPFLKVANFINEQIFEMSKNFSLMSQNFYDPKIWQLRQNVGMFLSIIKMSMSNFQNNISVRNSHHNKKILQKKHGISQNVRKSNHHFFLRETEITKKFPDVLQTDFSDIFLTASKLCTIYQHNVERQRLKSKFFEIFLHSAGLRSSIYINFSL